ncbi:hypothetical protein SAMN05660226_04019 [Parapedobacter luteus]|uniref:Uncharacterized protein n=1 Tax=Parapedobacter luteus TaxID=623280 RepID=A0A1T5FIQ7_9SPHI|nr:hypothetical protein SAMN05660226_04019 [Parapedobacter luteus]
MERAATLKFHVEILPFINYPPRQTQIEVSISKNLLYKYISVSGDEVVGKKKSPEDSRGAKCFHNGIILIVICFQKQRYSIF